MKQLLFITAIILWVQASLANFQVRDLKYSGDGCPANTVQVIMAPDNSSFSVLYDAFTMEAGGSTSQSTDTKSCTLKFEIDIPKGKYVDIKAADFRGFASLAKGVVVEQTVRHQVGFNKLANSGLGFQLLVGPTEGDYVVTSSKPTTKISKLLACLPLKDETQIILKTRIKMTGASNNRPGLMTVDTTDGRIEHKFYLNLKSCF